MKGADTMDIAGLSMALSQLKVSQQANISLMNKVMNISEIQSDAMIQMIEESTAIMEQSINPHIGGSVDIKI